jgi:hypothetical protein
MKPKLVIDLRYTATFESNSANAARATTRLLGVKSVLVEALFCDWSEEGNILFCPIHRAEYRELEKTEGTLWRNKYPKDILPTFTIIQSLQIIRELEEIWVLFPFNPANFERALKVLWKASNQDNRFIAVAESELPTIEECQGLRRADPTGKADFTLVAGKESKARDPKRKRGPTIFLGPGTFADIHTGVLP